MNQTDPRPFTDEPLIYQGLPLLCSGEFFPFLSATMLAPAEGGFVELTEVKLAGVVVNALIGQDQWADLEWALYRKIDERKDHE